jgi:hypothetical protein
VRNVSAVRAKHSSTVSRKSCFFEPKRRIRYGCETPARAAMSCVLVPS